jgi:hypothetical protein
MSERDAGGNVGERCLSNRFPPGGSAGKSRVEASRPGAQSRFWCHFSLTRLKSEHGLPQPVEQHAVATAASLVIPLCVLCAGVDRHAP